MWILIILQCLIALIGHFIIIASSDYPGGAIGMVPLFMMIAVPVQGLMSVIFYFVARRYLTFWPAYMLINGLIFEGIIFILTRSSLLDIFKQGLEGFIMRSYTIPYLVSSIIVIGIGYCLQKYLGYTFVVKKEKVH